MLKELHSIAADLLGLEGYPLQPLPWTEIFGARAATETTAAPVNDHGSLVPPVRGACRAFTPAIGPASR